ncbi:MAG: hypothetical protein Q4B43_10595 [Bacteroidota bacterium]|nr:hypothetical protein [Bacteroidota bacterium]
MNTLIFNGTAKDLKLLLDISQKIGIDLKVVEEKTALNPQQEKFKKRMRKNLQQVELLKKGKLKTQPLDEFLESL